MFFPSRILPWQGKIEKIRNFQNKQRAEADGNPNIVFAITRQKMFAMRENENKIATPMQSTTRPTEQHTDRANFLI